MQLITLSIQVLSEWDDFSEDDLRYAMNNPDYQLYSVLEMERKEVELDEEGLVKE
jgi:hypothetical protein